MDSDRPSISRSGERPVTRWRREQEWNEKPQIISDRPSSESRPYSKMERPISRRGIKTDITEFGMSRPPTSGRNMSRPPSASIIANRVPTASSRISTMSSINMSQMTPILSRSIPQPNIMIIDRPITQQGVAAIRPPSSRGISRSSRHIQDKKYYEQLLQIKIQELTQEIAVRTQEFEKQNRERSAYTHYDQRSRDFNVELAELQNQVAAYNIALQKISSGNDKEEIEKTAKRLKELNEREQAEIEHLIEKRIQAEKKLIELNKEIENKKREAEKIIENMDTETKYQYLEARKEKNKLQNEINGLRIEYDQMSAEKSKLEEKISLTPIKQEAYKLYIKIFKDEQAQEKLLEFSKNTLQEEKEKLIKKIKDDNLDVAAAEKKLQEIEQKVAEAEQELEQLETDIDKCQSQKQIKYNELKQREEIMEIFKSTFERNKAEELKKLSQLEDQIVERLEHISNSIIGNIDSNVLTDDEVEMLKNLMEQNLDNSGEKNIEELKQDNSRLHHILSDLEALELKITTAVNEFKERSFVTHDSEVYEDNVSEKKEVFYEQERPYQDEIVPVKRDYTKLKEDIEQNEIYRPISILESKLERAALENDTDYSKEQMDEKNYATLQEKLFALTARYNAILINELKSTGDRFLTLRSANGII